MNTDLKEEKYQDDSTWVAYLVMLLIRIRHLVAETSFEENTMSSVLKVEFEGSAEPHKWVRLVSS